jgi:hypothetical protein
MRALKNWKAIAAVIAGLLIGTVLFFPWKELSSMVLAEGFDVAAKNGIYASVKESSCEGILDKNFVYNGLTIDFPLFRFYTSELSVDPGMISSLLHHDVRAAVNLGRGEITPVTRQKLEWTEGSVNVTAGRDSVSVSDIDIRGKVSVSGYMEISRANGKISHARLTLKVPAEMDRAIQMLGSSGMFSVSKIKDGEWRITQ